MSVPMGPDNHTDYTPHCLRRDFSPWLFTLAGNQSVVDWTLNATDFWHLDAHVQGIGLGIYSMRVHGAGHMAIGGQIGEVSSKTPDSENSSNVEPYSCPICIPPLEILCSMSIMEALTGCGTSGSKPVCAY